MCQPKFGSAGLKGYPEFSQLLCLDGTFHHGFFLLSHLPDCGCALMWFLAAVLVRWSRALKLQSIVFVFNSGHLASRAAKSHDLEDDSVRKMLQLTKIHDEMRHINLTTAKILFCCFVRDLVTNFILKLLACSP